ncbi:MAG TPA: hypothetical protein VIE67_14615 [Rudaea sp.]|jgi:hypothetical protein|uniref:hypothetical protein n=1 Tax=Rudaea sp. TaxID=2136325 RepID=UPI002F94096A
MEQPALHVIPEPIRRFLTITEIDDADFLVGALFRRKFGDPPPDFSRHLVALYSDADGAHHLAGYSHMRPFGDIYLSGGSCSNGETIKRMQAQEREAVQAAGGVWYLILKYAFHKYANCCDAFFGHCGDRRALDVALAAGFVKTEHEHLIVHWHKPLADVFRRALTAKAHALGAF